MSKKFSYQFDPSSGILYKYYVGKISILDITASWEYAFAKQLVPKNVRGVILDYKAATFDIKIDEHTQIADFYEDHLEVFGGLKIAIITDNPKDIIIPSLVETKSNGYLSKPFSTLEAAINWVLN